MLAVLKDISNQVEILIFLVRFVGHFRYCSSTMYENGRLGKGTYRTNAVTTFGSQSSKAEDALRRKETR